MKPKPSIFTGPVPAIPAKRAKLVDLLHPSHPLVSLARDMNWPEFDLQFGCYYSDDQGRPALPTRLLTGLHYLKYAQNLSDEATVMQFLENPYWQYFCGNEFFEHELPCHPTTLSRWRKRIGVKGSRHPKQKDKIYSLHAPEVFRIAKGKAKKKYEFGSKVSIATTAKSCWVLAVQSFQGNPFDGHTLSDTLWMVNQLHNIWPDEVYLDQGCKGFDGLVWGSQA